MDHLGGRFEDKVHILPVRVYYEDTDAAGIVYHANYLAFAERARTEMVRLIGVGQRRMMTEQRIAFAVRHAAVDFRRPAYLDDSLDVRSCLTACGGASMELVQDVTREGEVLVRLDIRLACMTLDGGPARLPKDVRDVVGRYVDPINKTADNRMR